LVFEGCIEELRDGGVNFAKKIEDFRVVSGVIDRIEVLEGGNDHQ
jgi:hypothetical protein